VAAGTSETVPCEPPCRAEWSWVDRPGGVVTYRMPSNGRRGSGHVPARDEQVETRTGDDCLWIWECPFCEHAESDPLDPE
jgi:hypothetical protein